MTDEEMAAVKDGVVLLPMTAGAIVLAYNLPDGPSELKLSREAYVGIFLGKITQWDDPAIAKSNPGAKLPSTKITVVVRSDGSGTTFVFHFAPERDQRCVEERTGSGQVGQFSGCRGGQGQSRSNRADQGDAGRDRLRRVRLRGADQDADGFARRTRAAQYVKPDLTSGQDGAGECSVAGQSARMDHRSHGRAGLSDRHLHLAALLQEVPGSPEARCAQVGDRIRPDARARRSASILATSRCPPTWSTLTRRRSPRSHDPERGRSQRAISSNPAGISG